MSDAVASAYEQRAAEYIELVGRPDQLAAADRAEIADWAASTPGQILDAGCGPGLWTGYLNERGHDTVGIDVTEAFLTHARAQHPDLTFLHGSFATLPFQGTSLGGILAWYSLIHTRPDELPTVFDEFARALIPGGRLLIGYFHGEPGEHFDHAVTRAYFWNANALTGMLASAGFEVTASSTRGRESGAPSSRPHGAVTAVRRRSPARPA